MGTGLTGEEHQSDWCAMTQPGDFEAEDTLKDRLGDQRGWSEWEQIKILLLRENSA
jgi:hypothetical protein